MKKESLLNFYFLGTVVRYIQDVAPHYDVGTENDGNVLSNVKVFFENLDQLDLVVTRQAAWELRNVVLSLAQKAGTDKVAEKAAELSGAMTDLRRTLDAELSTKYAFRITPKVIETEKLLERVPDLFAPSAFSRLPEIAKFDFTEAAQCIAFERPTAAAFHVLRGTEAVLRVFYETTVRTKRIKNRMWGPLVTDMRGRSKCGVHGVLLNHLDHIRNAFRNPTQHPEAKYDIHEVQDLWSLCVDAVNRMARFLPEP